MSSSQMRVPTRRGDTQAWQLSGRRKVLIGVLAALAIGYVVGLVYYSGHFLPRTSAAGVDISALTPEDAAEVVERSVASYANHVSGEGLDFSVSGSSVGLVCDGVAFCRDVLSQANPAAWPLSFLLPKSYESSVGITIDESRLGQQVKDVVDTYNNGDSEDLDNETIVYDERQAKFVSTSEVANAMLSSDSVRDEIKASMLLLRPETVIGTSSLVRPELSESDAKLAEAAERANEKLSLTIPITFNGTKVMAADRSDIAGWLEVVEGPDGPEAKANADAVASWAYANLSDRVNGETETRVWEVDSAATGTGLADRVNNLDASPFEVPTVTLLERPPETEGASLRGRHVDVNISTQYARLYDDDGKVIWRSYVVTGDPSEDRSTPTGEFQIQNMEENVTLTGADENGDGAPDYESFVYYWMCYYGSSIGLHDATWRSPEEFGGDTYATDGSHGCVNLPFDAAAELYSLLRLGDPVSVHY